MPDHPPTQPAPMSESQLNAMSHPDDKPTFAELYQQRKALVAEIRRLNAAAKAAWKAAGDEMVWRMAVENDRDAKAKELTAVRAAVTEESQRADRAEAAARELYDVLDIVGGNSLIKYQPMIRATLAKAAKALGLTIAEEGKDNGRG